MVVLMSAPSWMGGGLLQRQHDSEDGATGLTVVLDRPAVVVDDLGDQCKTEASAGRLVGDEGVEQVGADLVGYAAAIVAHRHDQRQVHPRLLARHRQPEAMLVGGRQFDL